MNIDIARRNEIPQTFTTSDVNDIKQAINIPRANVTILNTVYSPEETKIGVWREYRTVDNEQVLMEKPVYTKTLTGTTPSTTGEVIISNIDDAENANIVSGYYTDVSGYNTPCNYTVNSISTASSYNMYATIKSDATRMVLGVANDSKSKPYRIIINYTKTTDEWEVVE